MTLFDSWLAGNAMDVAGFPSRVPWELFEGLALARQRLQPEPRACACGAETTQPTGACDCCTGEFRMGCRICGLEDDLVHRGCPGGLLPLAILN